MHILLTGHKGFIGKHLFDHLRSKHQVWGLDCDSDYQSFQKQWHETQKVGTFDYIVHAGAISDASYTDPDIFKLNTEATHTIVRYTASLKFKVQCSLIFLSTQMAFQPTNFYAWSKKYAEDAIRLSMIDYRILRLPNVFGDENFPKQSPSIVTKIKNGTLPFILPGYRRRIIHVDAVCDLISELIEKPYRHGLGLFNIACEEVSIEDMLTRYAPASMEQPPEITNTNIPLEIPLENLPMLSVNR